MKTRGYIFTIWWNENEEYYNYTKKLLDSANYSIIGKETCPTTGRKHLQCYAYWENQKTYGSLINSANKLLRENGCEYKLLVANGSAKQNQAYCSKEQNYTEFGELPTQGQRSDITTFRDAILSGATEEDLIMEFPSMMAQYDRFYRRVKTMMAEKESKKMIPPEITVIIGDAGAGKTRLVYEKHDIDDIYRIITGDGSDGSLWWDGYNGQDVILIDDFNNDIKLGYMLQLLDRYPMRLQVKGGTTYRCATKIYITTNLELHQWYPNCQSRHSEAIRRRIHNVINLKKSQYQHDQRIQHNMLSSQTTYMSDSTTDASDTNKEEHTSSSMDSHSQEQKIPHYSEQQTETIHKYEQPKHIPSQSETYSHIDPKILFDLDVQEESQDSNQHSHQYQPSPKGMHHNHSYPIMTHYTSYQKHDMTCISQHIDHTTMADDRQHYILDHIS